MGVRGNRQRDFVRHIRKGVRRVHEDDAAGVLRVGRDLCERGLVVWGAGEIIIEADDEEGIVVAQASRSVDKRCDAGRFQRCAHTRAVPPIVMIADGGENAQGRFQFAKRFKALQDGPFVAQGRFW